MRCVVDVQHAGKPTAARDRGAKLGDRTEVWATRRYGLALVEALEEAGHEVFTLSDGEYRDRHKRCDALRPDVYLALHLDAGIAGRGDRGAVFHWPGSALGGAMAASVASSVSLTTPWQVRAVPAVAGAYDRVRACVAGVAAPALLLEPGFCDGALGGSWLLDEANLQRLGRAIAHGLG